VEIGSSFVVVLDLGSTKAFVLRLV
jgi:hypothetical protein